MTLDALNRAIGDADSVLLDSSALIAYHSRSEAVHPLAKHLLNRIEDERDRLHGYFSVVSAAELLIRPYRAGIGEFTLMHTFLSNFPHLTAISMDLQVASQAATIRAISGLRLPDAIIIASGVLTGCQVIISNDEEWRRKLEPLFSEFKWICLGDYR